MNYTFNRLIEFNEAAKNWYRTQKEETEFSNAIDIMVERIRPHFEGEDGYNKRANRINRSTAIKDSKHKGVIVTNGYGQYQYTIGGLEKRDELMHKLGEELIDIEPMDCSLFPDMTLEQNKIFKGIINEVKIEKSVPVLTLEPSN